MTFSVGLINIKKDEVYHEVADRIMKQSGQTYTHREIGAFANAVSCAAHVVKDAYRVPGDVPMVSGSVSGWKSGHSVSLTISFTAVGYAEPVLPPMMAAAPQPPADNDHVAPGAERFPEPKPTTIPEIVYAGESAPSSSDPVVGG